VGLTNWIEARVSTVASTRKLITVFGQNRSRNGSSTASTFTSASGASSTTMFGSPTPPRRTPTPGPPPRSFSGSVGSMPGWESWSVGPRIDEMKLH
jgi:hypothetical protein